MMSWFLLILIVPLVYVHAYYRGKEDCHLEYLVREFTPEEFEENERYMRAHGFIK